MVKIVDDCVGCPQGCINCGRRYTPVLQCDECDNEGMDFLYEVDGKELCEDCALDHLDKITLSEACDREDMRRYYDE